MYSLYPFSISLFWFALFSLDLTSFAGLPKVILHFNDICRFDIYFYSKFSFIPIPPYLLLGFLFPFLDLLSQNSFFFLFFLSWFVLAFLFTPSVSLFYSSILFSFLTNTLLIWCTNVQALIRFSHFLQLHPCIPLVIPCVLQFIVFEGFSFSIFLSFSLLFP